MTMKCGKCNLELKHGELSVKCIECSTEFHPGCTGLDSQNFTKLKSKNWKCEICLKVPSSSSLGNNAPPTAAIDKNTLLEALNSFKAELKSHTDAAIGGVIKKLDTLKENLQVLNDRFTSLEQNQAALQGCCDVLEQANTKITDEVRALRARLDDAEQHSRCANIEILGIPSTAEENIYMLLIALARALGISYERKDISIAHRLRLFSGKHAHPPIICQFVSRSVKEQWLVAARKKRNLKTTDFSCSLQPSVVYINDHLTANNKGLLGRARRLQREGKIHFAGYFNGKVLVKQQERGATVRIVHQEDLDKFDK